MFLFFAHVKYTKDLQRVPLAKMYGGAPSIWGFHLLDVKG